MPNKGIVDKKWSYKLASDPESEWTEEKLTKASPGKKYYLKLDVLDMEGAWGTKTLIFFPDEKGTLTLSPKSSDWKNINIGVSFLYNPSSLLRTFKYQWSNSIEPPTSSLWTDIPTNYVKIEDEGIHYLHVHAFDTSGSVTGTVGGPYKIDKTKPTVSVDKTAGVYSAPLTVNINALDSLSGIKSMIYNWSTYQSGFVPSYGAVTTQETFGSITQSNIGSYYLYIQAIDNAGNTILYCYGPYTTISNRPPTVNIIGVSPSVAYEGDDITVRVQPNDPDNDDLTVDMVLYKDGLQIWNKTTTISALAGGGYDLINQVVRTDTEPGSYRLTVKVTDPLGLSASAETSYFVSTLGITVAVRHTDLWNSHRQKYNVAKSGNANSPRTYSMFFPGERFILSADTSAIDASRPDLYAQNVTCVLLDTSYSDSMSSSNKIRWDGDIWDESMIRWGSRALTFRFTVTYSNGAVKTYDVPATIADDEYWRLHMYF